MKSEKLSEDTKLVLSWPFGVVGMIVTCDNCGHQGRGMAMVARDTTVHCSMCGDLDDVVPMHHGDGVWLEEDPYWNMRWSDGTD